VTNQSNKPPFWVLLAFSSIRTRKGALILIAVTALFTLYCLPWASMSFFPQWLSALFLITDWSWFAMMLPITAWYLLCLRWMDAHSAWEAAKSEEEC